MIFFEILDTNISKREGGNPLLYIRSYYLNYLWVALNLQLLQRQPIIILSEKSSVNKFQTKSLIILVVIILGAEVLVTIARGVLLEEA